MESVTFECDQPPHEEQQQLQCSDGAGLELGMLPKDISPVALTALFGGMWAMTGRAPDPRLCETEYKQCLNKQEYYVHMRHELLSIIMSAAMHNSQNLWLLNVAMPIFESSVKTYTKHEKEWNALPYTPKIEGGTDNQPTYSESKSEQTSGIEVSQSVSFSVNLSRDPLFGAKVWLENLSELQKNLALTMMRSSITDLRDLAYRNSTHDKQGRFIVERLFANEVNTPFISVQNPRAFLDLIIDYMAEYEGLNLCILPPRASRFLADIPEQGVSKEMPAMSLYYSPQEMRLKPKMKKGPHSVKTIRTPHGEIHFKEIVNFKVNRHDKNPYAPLTTTEVFGEFFECNPRIGPNDRVTSASSEALDMWITFQSQQRTEKRKLAFRDCLRHCFYWDPVTGQISSHVKNYIKQLNVKRDAPFQWKQPGKNDINEDRADFNVPDYEAKKHMGPLTTMETFRGHSVVAVWDARMRQWREANFIGAMHLCVLPNKWIMPVVNALSFVFFQETGIHPSSIVARLSALRDKIMKAPITAAAIKKLIDAQMLPLMNNGGPVTKNGLPEFVPDSNGSLRLPANDDGSLTGMKYFNGFQSGAGLLTARDWQLQSGSAFAEMSQEASEVLYPVERWIDFIAEHVGASEVIDPEMAKEWFIVDRELVRQTGGRDPRVLATFIDTVYPPGVPVFLGKPKVGGSSYGDVERNDPTSVIQVSSGLKDLFSGDLSLVTKERVTAAVNAGGTVTPAIEALACLSLDYAKLLKKEILTFAFINDQDDAVKQTFVDACNKLFELVIKTCGYPAKFIAKKVNVKENNDNRKLVTSIADQFFAIILKQVDKPLKDRADEAMAYVTKMFEPKYFAEQAVAITKTAAYVSQEPSLASALALGVQASSIGLGFTGEQKTVRDRQEDFDTAADTNGGGFVRYFKGNYSGDPTQYLRSPLMSSPKLVDFIKETGFLWALPADKTSNFTTPEYSVAKRPLEVKKPSEFDLGSLRAQLSGFDARLSAMSRHSGSSGVQFSEKPSTSRGLESRGRPSADSLFSFGVGRPGDESDEDMEADDNAADKRHSWDRATMTAGQQQKKTAAELAEEVMQQHYYGPWRARMEFADTIKDHWERAMFKAVCLAPNTLQTHENFCDMGVSVINLMPIRPAMRFKASSAILMKTGAASKRMSPVDVDISKNRDTFEVQVGFEHGTVIIEETKIHMLKAVFPEAYEGGKNMEFITNHNQYALDDANKPAIIVMPYSIATRDFAETIHVLNKATTRKLEKNERANPMAKVEFSGFFQSVFTHDATNMMETLQQERSSFNRRGLVTHVLHKGTRTIYDPNTRETMEIEGFGSVNSIAMNRPGVETVFQQINDYLPPSK